MLVLSSAALLAAGGGQSSAPGHDVTGRPAGVWIRATPNPVPDGTGHGATVVAWSAGASLGQVYVAIDGQPEILFAGESRDGSQEAPWIDHDIMYEFRLYAGRDHRTQLAAVTVERQRAGRLERGSGWLLGLSLVLISLVPPTTARRRGFIAVALSLLALLLFTAS